MHLHLGMGIRRFCFVLNKKTNNNKYRRATDALMRSSPRLREEVAAGVSSLESLVDRGNPRHGPIGGPPGSHSVSEMLAGRGGLRNAYKAAIQEARLACVLAPSS